MSVAVPYIGELAFRKAGEPSQYGYTMRTAEEFLNSKDGAEFLSMISEPNPAWVNAPKEYSTMRTLSRMELRLLKRLGRRRFSGRLRGRFNSFNI